MTRRWHIDEAPTALQLNEIAKLLREGSVVLMPTDTIYGLHAVATNAEAVERIADIKGRDETKPFIVIASSTDQIRELGISTSSDLLASLASLWPRPPPHCNPPAFGADPGEPRRVHAGRPHPRARLAS